MDRKVGHLTKDISNVASSLTWIKVVGIGNTSVGKTCLIKHFCESKFSNSYQPTVGVDYGFKIQTINGIDLRVHLWDLSGNQEYLDVRNELYAGTDAVFLVYDITSQSSFDSLDVWLREFDKYGSPDAQICLVGNKIDQKAKQVISSGDGKKWAAQHNIKFYETSAASGSGIENMFTELLKSVVDKKKLPVTDVIM